ncbi:MAG: ribonuclease R [Bacteroidetes bacterium]|nr:ribonuclease R [Bacteroidota bacterium]
MTKKKQKSSKKLTAQDLQIAILKFLLANPKRQYAPRQIIEQLKVENNIDSVSHALTQLVQAGSVYEADLNRYGLALQRLIQVEEKEADAPPVPEKPLRKKKPVRLDASESDVKPLDLNEFQPVVASKRRNADWARKTVQGRVDMTRTGAAYIVSELMDTDVYVPMKYVNGALHGDTVEVLLFPVPPRKGGRKGFSPQRKPEGEILRVLKRAHEFFIGTLRISRNYALFYADSLNMTVDVYVPMEAIGAAKDGDKVVVKITDWQEGKGRVPMGAVTEVLGDLGGNDFEMKKILINAGFELAHSEESMREADAIPETLSDQEIERRRDFREVLTFTIDPVDARDFDDALSIRVLENEHLEIGVHIADVTHYLKPDSPMDKEAYQRSTSVYLVDRVNPMLPEKLSNNLCSLVPHADRLTFSAVFEFDKKDKLVGRWFGKTVIHSDKRFTYEAAQTILDAKPDADLVADPLFEKYDWALKTMDRIAKKMRKEREKNGAIGFETDEIRFKLGPKGEPVEVYVKDRRDTNLLIEDYMLLANKEVALFIDQKAQSQQEIPFVYRIHDLPDMEKVAEFARFAQELGVKMKLDTPKQLAHSFNELMIKSRTDARLKLLEPLAIRTMAKAVYSSKNIGHYGLGFTHYSHFTSPIRRYSDVLAHRILERNLDGKVYRVDKTKLEEQCKHISSMERKAADAERESIKYKQVEYTKRFVGQTLTGTVSGMLERGFFVELPDSRAEGMVEFRGLSENYTIEDGNLRAHAKRSGNSIKIGDRVQVRVVSTDLQKRQIDLELVED